MYLLYIVMKERVEYINFWCEIFEEKYSEFSKFLPKTIEKWRSGGVLYFKIFEGSQFFLENKLETY